MSIHDSTPSAKLVEFPDQKSPSRPIDARTDDELMLLTAAGNNQAFTALVERHITGLTNYCAKVTGDTDEAFELASAALAQIWQSRNKYKAQGRFKVLLFTAARNACFNYRRSVRRRLKRQSSGSEDYEKALETASSSDTDQLDKLIQQERDRQVRAAMTQLPARMREALLLRFEQDLDYTDIASVVGRSESTVRSRVFHGLKKLRNVLPTEVLR